MQSKRDIMTKRFFYKAKKSYDNFQYTMAQLSVGEFGKLKETLEKSESNKKKIYIDYHEIVYEKRDPQQQQNCLDNFEQTCKFQQSDLVLFIMQNYQNFEVKHYSLINAYNKIDAQIRQEREKLLVQPGTFILAMGTPTIIALVLVITAGLGTGPLLALPGTLLIITLFPVILNYFRYRKSLQKESETIKKIVAENPAAGFEYTKDLTLETFDDQFETAIQNCLQEARNTLSDKSLKEKFPGKFFNEELVSPETDDLERKHSSQPRQVK